MPGAPLRFCAAAGCSRLVPKGRCPEHAGASRDSDRERDRRRGTARSRGYTTRWQYARAKFLRRYPFCGMRPGGRPPVMSRCHDEGRTSAGHQVDHVIPHRGNDALFWAEDNWQTLCQSCGAAKSAAGM